MKTEPYILFRKAYISWYDSVKHIIGGFFQLKKIIAALFVATLTFAAVGPVLSSTQPLTADARGYKSGKSGFNVSKSPSNNNTNSNVQNKSNTTNNKSTNQSAAQKSNKGGLMKGLMLGGLAGLLFGGLLSGMGAMGNILGLLVNIIAILVVIMLIAKIVSMFRNNKRDKEEEDRKAWKS